jgi:ribosomal protein S18 acetylase RimI-like enzyme
MSHLLDNMIWNAISTGNKDLADLDGDVGVYRSDIAPFAGMKELNHKNLDHLYDFLSADRKVALSFFEKYELDESKWKTIVRMNCCQMVYDYSVESFKTKNSHLIVPLTDEHIPQMLELTALTKPGPFLERTIDFENYFGIFIDGRLAAMSGQRMHPVPYLEVSAVCTHPDFRGHGYAKAIMLHVMQIILDNKFIPFLHVLTSNTTAIQLYESIGYRVRREVEIDVVVKK